MITPKRLLAITAVTLGMLACSSSSGTGTTKTTDGGTGSGKGSGSGTGTSGGSSVSSFCTQLLAADAALLSKCLGGPVSAWEAEIGTSNACSQVVAAVSAGRVTFDSTQAAACIGAYSGASCTDFSAATEPAACTATLKGTVADKSTCYNDIDCGATSYCSGLGGASASCTGTCAPRLAAAATCTSSDKCVTGYSCSSGAGGAMTCTASTTATPAALGATCGYDSKTSTFVSCGAGLACSSKTSTCVTQVATGAACTPGAGVCEPFSACDPTTKKCAAYPAAGGKCGEAAGQDPVACAPGSYCQPATGTPLVGTCATLGASGAACSSGTQCASGSCAKHGDGGAGTCAAACTQE